MENMQYAEELVREFLVFRGFTNTLQAYEAELSTEIGRNFEVDKILDLVFSVYIPKYQLDRLLGLFSFFKQCFTSPADTELFSTLVKLEQSVLRYYVINALKSGSQEKVIEFFGANGNYLMQKREDWLAWFGACSELSFAYIMSAAFLCFANLNHNMQLFHILKIQAWIHNSVCISPKNGWTLWFFHFGIF